MSATINLSTLHCRLLCAANCAYGISATGVYDTSSISVTQYSPAVQWTSPPVAIAAGPNAALVGESMDGIIVAFRGTFFEWGNITDDATTVHDILTDINGDLIAVPLIPGKVHTGFWNAVEDILAGIVEAVVALGGGKPIYVTGHSKGGAMAALFGARIHFDPPSPAIAAPTAIVTFAGARAGDATFVQYYPYTNLYTRYEFLYDLVPHLPPSGAVIEVLEKLPIGATLKSWLKAVEGYTSIGDLHLITADSTIEMISDSGIIAELEEAMYDGEMLWNDALNFSDILSYHHPDCGFNYMSAVCSCCAPVCATPPGTCP